MNTIYKITLNSTIDFAAEELKKYICMMMVESGNISISYNKDAKEGLRIGLMSDFGIDTSDADDISLDDIIYIDANENGGVIAGSNPGATLIAVYRYLRFCGCRWLFPGVDGEWIPTIRKLPDVSYRKLADHRYRGQCNEGAEFQSNMIEAIDFTPKIGMNSFMIEFDNPICYYDAYYNHKENCVRKEEPVSKEMVKRWKRQCEAEIQKRGLHFHDMGHGWTAEPFGLDSSDGWKPIDGITLNSEIIEHLAMLDGERKVRNNTPLCSNVCLSNPKTRKIMADYIADYSQKHSNVDFLHVWLADESNSHCECSECQKKNTSDWYVMLLNDIDAELTKRNLDTHIVFIVYLDTFYAPLTERLNNDKRFTMLYAPITRSYNETYDQKVNRDAVVPYVRNNIKKPHGMSECLAYLYDWKNKMWSGDCFCYEYHFMLVQFNDLSNLELSKILYDDIQALKCHGLRGIIEDGSQRSYFPTGFQFYVYGETLFDSSVSFEELKEDDFSHAFGENWKDVIDYFEKLGSLMRYTYFQGLESKDISKGNYYNPEMVENAKKAKRLVKDFIPVIEKNLVQSQRSSTVAWQILGFSAFATEKLTQLVEYVAVDDTENANKALNEIEYEMSKQAIYFERYYDHHFFIRNIRKYAGNKNEFDNMTV